MMDPVNDSAVAGPSQHSASLGFVSEAVQWSLNMENLQTRASSVPPRMEQQFEGGPSEDLLPHNNITVPILCTVSTVGLVWLRNPFQPEPRCQNLHPAPAHMNENQALNKDVLGTHSQGDFTATVEPPAPPALTVGAVVKPGKSKKTCHCTRSQCLKCYCSCFANGLMCKNCDCSNCFNNVKHKLRHLVAKKSCQKHNPDAFKPKVIQGSRGVKGWHAKGCNCKRCGCFKNYCECFEAAVSCTPSCKCVGCMNKF